MRLRSKAKRQEIVDLAALLFLEHGYQGTSMSLVSQRLGGSKTTLYSYFRSKEELLLAVLEEEVVRGPEKVCSEDPGDDTREFLRRTGLHYLQDRLGSRNSRLFRIVASLPEDSHVGHRFHQSSIVPTTRLLADLMATFIDKGVLCAADPWTMATHFKGMLEQDFVERSLLSPRDEISRREIEQSAFEAADTFMRAYRSVEVGTPRVD